MLGMYTHLVEYVRPRGKSKGGLKWRVGAQAHCVTAARRSFAERPSFQLPRSVDGEARCGGLSEIY